MALSSFNFDDLTLPNVIPEQANEVQGEADQVEEDQAVQGEADQVEKDEADQVEAQVAEPQEVQVQPPPSQKKKQRLKLQVTRKYRTRQQWFMSICVWFMVKATVVGFLVMVDTIGLFSIGYGWFRQQWFMSLCEWFMVKAAVLHGFLVVVDDHQMA
nr:hypothetical protein Itr_chr01CG07050 [Ipomoea trifida]